jgi:hypothetical protein
MTIAQEQRQILDMLAEGKITADEAHRILEKLNGAPSRSPEPGSGWTSPADARAESGPASRTALLADPEGRARTGRPAPKYLRILVHSDEGDQVNIRIPLQIVRAGLKLTAVLPREAREKLRESGVDLSSLSELQGEALIDALRELSIDVDSSEGERVRIFCE